MMCGIELMGLKNLTQYYKMHRAHTKIFINKLVFQLRL